MSYNITDKFDILIGVYIADYSFILTEIRRLAFLLFSKSPLFTYIDPPPPPSAVAVAPALGSGV